MIMSSDLNTLSERTHIRKLMDAHTSRDRRQGEVKSWWPLVLTTMYEFYLLDQDEREHWKMKLISWNGLSFFLSLYCYKVICMTTFSKAHHWRKGKNNKQQKWMENKGRTWSNKSLTELYRLNWGMMFDPFHSWGTSSPRRWGDQEAHRNKVHGEPLQLPRWKTGLFEQKRLLGKFYSFVIMKPCSSGMLGVLNKT